MDKKRKEDIKSLQEVRAISERLLDEFGWLNNFAVDPKRPRKGGESIGRQKGTHSDPTADAATDPYAQKVRKLYAKAQDDVSKALGLLRHAEVACTLAMGGDKKADNAYDVIEASEERIPKAELRRMYAKQKARHEAGGGYGES